MVDPEYSPFHRLSSNRLTAFMVRFKEGSMMSQAAFASMIGPEFTQHYV